MRVIIIMVFMHSGYPAGDGNCAAPACDCGKVPCGFYVWNHSSTRSNLCEKKKYSHNKVMSKMRIEHRRSSAWNSPCSTYRTKCSTVVPCVPPSPLPCVPSPRVCTTHTHTQLRVLEYRLPVFQSRQNQQPAIPTFGSSYTLN